MALGRTLRAGVTAICIACTAAPAGLAAAPAGPSIRVAQAKDFSRLEFRGRVRVRREGQTLVVSLPRDADTDALARLKVDPPRWVKSAETLRSPAGVDLKMTLTDDADLATGAADGSTFINIFKKAAAPTAAAATSTETASAEPPPSPQPVRANPVPKGGVVRMSAEASAGQVKLSFPWANPNGAAVFRRGEAVWVVFDAPATLDISRAPRGLRQFKSMSAYRGPDYSAVRIQSSAGTPVFAEAQGSVWTVTLGNGATGRQLPIKVTRSEGSAAGALTAVMPGATRVISVPDPVVGDSVKVATALAPSKGLPSRREFVEMALLPSAQGLAVEPFAEDVQISYDGDLVTIGRPQGLALSPQAVFAKRPVAVAAGAPQPAELPALIDYENWPKTGSGGFMSRYGALLDAAAAETGKGAQSPTGARMALARFLVGSELSYEAIGVLNALVRQHPESANDPEFRGLRGAARVMARRYKEAEADFSSPVLSDDPSSALWRSFIAAQTGQWNEARAQYAAGASSLNRFAPAWQARFARGDAEAALELGDIAGAEARIKTALQPKVDPREQLASRLVQARILEAQGKTAWALHIYNAVSRSSADYLVAPAMLRATEIKLQQGQIAPAKAAAVFDSLRYRWRGDGTELETIRALGNLYLKQGRYREALEALRTAGQRLINLPQASDLQADLNNAFRGLFLDGLADGLEPIQALAMFYDFKELTPLGSDGDLMVRKLVRRLVDVDLLPQAAELLKYQVENRLDGAARGQVATDLAVIYLMDRKPEQALMAINGSRTTILPPALNAERRQVEARALMELGRQDHALEVLGKDATPAGQDLRAEIAWKQKDWGSAGTQFEKALGDRFKRPGPLSPEDENRLLRAGVAFSLAGDDASLNRLEGRYKGFYDQASNPEALRVALTGMSTSRLSISDFASSIAANDAFGGWVGKMKQRFRDRAKTPAAATAPAAPAPARQAAAESPAKKG